MSNPSRPPWTPEQLRMLRARYPNTRTEDLARDIGRSTQSCYIKARALGIKKSADYLAGPDACRLRRDTNPGIQTRFHKGQQPWNKGSHYVAGGRSAETRFRPGSTPANRLPVGHIRLNSEGYLDIKVAEGRRQWVPLHRWNWLQAHGSLPGPDLVVIFRDGDRMNCDIGNLALITRRDNMARNTVHQLPKEVAELVQLRGALLRKIRNAEKHQSQETPAS